MHTIAWAIFVLECMEAGVRTRFMKQAKTRTLSDAERQYDGPKQQVHVYAGENGDSVCMWLLIMFVVVVEFFVSGSFPYLHAHMYT